MTRRSLILITALTVITALAALWAPTALAQPDYDRGKALIGHDLYRSYCATCHGAEAKGDGPLAEVLTVPPSDLTQISAENGGVFPAERTHKIIDGREKVPGHGSRDMPAWGDAFEAISQGEDDVKKKIDNLVHFLMSIQVDGGPVEAAP